MSFFKFFVERAKLVFLYYFNFVFPTNTFSSYQEKIVTFLLFQVIFKDMVDCRMNNFSSVEDGESFSSKEEIAKGFFLSFVRPKLGKPIPLEEMDF